MGSPGRHAARPITPRSAVATILVVLVVFALGLVVALPAHEAYAQKQEAQAQGQDLAAKVLEVCHEGGDAAAPLITIGACPLAQQVRSMPLAAVPEAAPLTAEQIDAMIRAEIARSLSKQAAGPPAPAGPAPPRPGEVVEVPGPSVNNQVPTTEADRPPAPPPPTERVAPYRYPAPPYRYRSPRQVTMTEQAPPPQRYRYDQQPAPVTVTERAPPTVTQTVQAPAPVTQTVNEQAPPQPAAPAQQPAAPAQQPGVPLLNGVGGLLNGLGSGL